MEKSIITTGKTIDDAVEAALAQLGLTRDDVSYQVISLPKSGFFGIGAVPAKVQVTYEAPDLKPAVKAEAKPEKKVRPPRQRLPPGPRPLPGSPCPPLPVPSPRQLSPSRRSPRLPSLPRRRSRPPRSRRSLRLPRLRSPWRRRLRSRQRLRIVSRRMQQSRHLRTTRTIRITTRISRLSSQR